MAPNQRLMLQLKGILGSVTVGDISGASRQFRLTIRRPPTWLVWALVIAFLSLALLYEVKTSALQSRVFSYFGGKMTYSVQRGPSSSIVFPAEGPFDVRYGYSRLAQFQYQLEQRGFEVNEQANFSPWMYRLALWGITPPYRDADVPGLVIRSSDGEVIHDGTGSLLFQNYEEIPPVIINALLQIENRQLGVEPFDPRRNPVVEWDRLAKAALTYGGTKLGLPVSLEGGSTLATQLEKYRHSPFGRTDSAREKLRQLVAASLKAYRNGSDTSEERREIVVDYLNSMPLAAVPGFGEVNGLGQGLRAWFGADLQETRRLLAEPGASAEKSRALKQVLTLLAAVRAPAHYLLQDRQALEARVNFYTRVLASAGQLDEDVARQIQDLDLQFSILQSDLAGQLSPEAKLSSILRTDLSEMLGVADLYTLNRFDLHAGTTVDVGMQEAIQQMFAKLKDEQYLEQNGFKQDRLLLVGNPNSVIYSLILFESTPSGNLLRVQADSLARPLDVNTGIKMELGSTAKLRTLAHYLEVVALLYSNADELSPRYGDPLSTWMRETKSAQPRASLSQVLEQAMDRVYSASPYESFFTGGGVHTFGNFDKDDNVRRMPVREATRRSTNLVFIRLMRDLVRYHQARLPYDSADVLANPLNPARQTLLREASDAESKIMLLHAFRTYREIEPDKVAPRLLGRNAANARHLAILFYAWNKQDSDKAGELLGPWLRKNGIAADEKLVRNMIKAYGNPRLTLADYAYLLNRHPLDLWCAGQIRANPSVSWSDIWEDSSLAREVSSEWLFKPRNRRAQDIRLRIRIEQDAFVRMTPYWKRLGFPFDRLVPSYATAIGNSSDRPVALADLMGIILNNGIRKPSVRFDELKFGYKTPYHTVLRPGSPVPEQVMAPEIARTLRLVLADVVNNGTARRVAGIFKHPDGTPLTVGGKTGSGDNRLKSFSRGGGLIGSKAVNRTATFAFYIGDRYFGVVTASVIGNKAGVYRFTSALPVEILKRIAPSIMAKM